MNKDVSDTTHPNTPENVSDVVVEAKDVIISELNEKIYDIKDDIKETVESTKKEILEAKDELIAKVPDALDNIKLKIKKDISEGKINLKSPSDIPIIVMHILKDDIRPIIETILKDVVAGIDLEPHLKAIIVEAMEGDWYDVMKILKDNSEEIAIDVAEEVAEKALKTGCFGLMGLIIKAIKK